MLASDTYAVSGTFHNDYCDIPHSSAQIVLGTVNWEMLVAGQQW